MSRPRQARKAAAPVAAGDLARAVLGRYASGEEIDCVRLQLAWPELAGRLAQACYPARIVDGVLTIHARDSQWVHELAYLKADLLAAIQARFPSLPLRDLRTRIGEVPEPAVAGGAEVIAAPAAFSAEVSDATRRAIEALPAGSLQQAVATARVALARLR
jgi:hypothetical protein